MGGSRKFRKGGTEKFFGKSATSLHTHNTWTSLWLFHNTTRKTVTFKPFLKSLRKRGAHYHNQKNKSVWLFSVCLGHRLVLWMGHQGRLEWRDHLVWTRWYFQTTQVRYLDHQHQRCWIPTFSPLHWTSSAKVLNVIKTLFFLNITFIVCSGQSICVTFWGRRKERKEARDYYVLFLHSISFLLPHLLPSFLPSYICSFFHLNILKHLRKLNSRLNKHLWIDEANLKPFKP